MATGVYLDLSNIAFILLQNYLPIAKLIEIDFIFDLITIAWKSKLSPMFFKGRANCCTLPRSW